MSRRVILVLSVVPALLGLGLAVLLQRDVLPNLLFVGTYRIDLAAVVSLGGLLLTLVYLLVFGVRRWTDRRIAAARTEARAAQAAAHQRFLRRLDHELKNPLTIIRLGLTNLQHSDGLTPEERASLQRITQQAQRLQRLVEDLRRLVELEAHGLERVEIQLYDVLEEAVALACDTPERREREVKLEVQQVPWPLTPVWGDRDLLIVAFRNLLDNALKFTTAGDRVEVRASEDGGTAVVEVADTGSGIPPEERTHIFEELYRGEQAREVPGSGLGLALVQRIVALHGGEISVRSRVGEGTLMTVRLPLAEERE